MAHSPLQSPPPLLIPPPGQTLPPPSPPSSSVSPTKSRNTSSERKPSPLRGKHKKPSREWALLFAQEDGVHNLHRVLLNVTEQLRAEKSRADEAERKVQDVLMQLRIMNEAKNAALRDAASANAALEQYKRRLEQAQNEIYRAQDVLKAVDAQRHEAEKMAARDRTTAHKLREENLVYLAREEGRRIGLKEGFDRGRDMGYHEGFSRAQSIRRYDDDEEDEDYYDTGDEEMSPLSDESNDYDEPPPVQANLPRRTPSEPPTPVPPPSTSGDIRPIPVRNSAPSPHPPIRVPPDNDIPEVGEDHYIHLPAPHEMSRPPTMPVTPASLPPVPEGEESPLRVPPPESVHSRRSIRSMRSIDHVRRSSPESNSTTISQFDMVKDPGPSVGRRSPMSVIPEVLSAQASPNPATIRGTPSLKQQPSFNTPAIAVTRVAPSPRTAMANLEALEQAALRGVYTRTRSSSSSSDSSRSKKSKTPSSNRRQSSASMNTVPDINIEPPSRPPSSIRRSSSDAPPRRMGNLLSPEDAHRIRTLPSVQPVVTQESAPPPPPPALPPAVAAASNPSATPIILPDGQLPLGFVPSTFTPALPADQLLPPLFVETGGGGGMPGGFSNTGGGDVVIPDRSLFGGDMDESGSSSERSSGLGSDANTLTTPPGRSRTPLTSYSGTTSRLSAAGIPLPPSTVSGTPRSGAGYLYHPAPDPGSAKGVKRKPSKASTVRTSRSSRG